MVQGDLGRGLAGGDEDKAVQLGVASSVALVAAASAIKSDKSAFKSLSATSPSSRTRKNAHVVLLLDQIAHRERTRQLKVDHLA